MRPYWRSSTIESFSDHIPSSGCSVFWSPCTRPAGGALSAGFQLHCHVQPPVWALLLGFPDSLKSHEWTEREASAFHKSCTLLLRSRWMFHGMHKNRKIIYARELREQLLHSLIKIPLWQRYLRSRLCLWICRRTCRCKDFHYVIRIFLCLF